MTYLLDIAEKVRTGAPLPAPLAAILTAATPVTRLGMALRRLRRPVRVDAHVISFGNITAGGTGKTPAVIDRVIQEVAAGRRVAVLTRGYGASRQDRTISMLGTEAARQPDIVGDEPALIGRRAPEAYIIRDADRVRAAAAAIAHGCDTLVLDDGFQYLRLARDENIVLIDATSPFGNGHLLPRGTLREPLAALRRATSFIVTRCDQAPNVLELVQELNALCPGTPVRLTQHRPVSLWNSGTGARLPVASIVGKEIAAVSAIARPEAFWKTLETLGAQRAAAYSFRDHAPINPQCVEFSGMVVTTEKDAVRMQTAPDNWWALEIVLQDWP